MKKVVTTKTAVTSADNTAIINLMTDFYNLLRMLIAYVNAVLAMDLASNNIVSVKKHLYRKANISYCLDVNRFQQG